MKKNFLKAVLYIFLSLMFLVVLFPYEDLSGLVSKQIAKATRNKVFIKFENLDLNLLPFGVDLGDIEMITPTLPVLKATSLSLSPSIPKLLAMKYGGSMTAEGLLGANVYANLTMGKPSDKEEVIHNLDDLEIEDLNLAELSTLIPDLPAKLKGRINVDLSDVTFEQNLKSSPAGEFNISSQKISINSPTLNVPSLGSLSLPDLNFSKTNFKGRLIDGQLNIENAQIGDKNDVLQLTSKGKVDLKLNKLGSRILPNWSNYEFKIKLTVSDKLDEDYKSLLSTLNLFLSLQNYKKPSSQKGYSDYTFKISGNSFRSKPNTSATKL